jgi:NAD(P)-dependent dehydrogenase (short-subunit alcohol dehydrogenase family)
MTSATVIFGATGGIGSAVARRLAGTPLVVTGRDTERTHALARDIGAVPAIADAGDTTTFDAAIATAQERFGSVGAVVNAIGSLLLKPGHVTSDEEFGAVLEANLWSTFAAVRAGAKSMYRSGGSIVAISTAAVRTGIANHEAVAAAKGGVEGLVRSAAATYAPKGIRVNAVAPGLVRTPMTERLTASEPSEAASVAMHAVGRLGEPGDVASAVVWLIDPDNDWVTGQVLGVDGGLGSLRPR